MAHAQGQSWFAAAAEEVLAVSDAGGQVQPFSSRFPEFTFADAYAIAQRVHDIRVARGESAIGRKIGFTNRTVWDSHGLSAPIWGYMYDTTVRDLSSGESRFNLAGLAEPRIEPEIVLRIAGAPRPDMSDDALIGCIEWIAHGFEIVQSIFPGWAFQPADAVAAQGVHAALLIGERHPVSDDPRRWGEALSNFRIRLFRDGEVVTSGCGHDVLGGPIQALRFLVQELARHPESEPLRSGEIVTTGTLTRAMPVAPGETWRTAVMGIDVEGLQVRFG